MNTFQYLPMKRLNVFDKIVSHTHATSKYYLRQSKKNLSSVEYKLYSKLI